jgi:hypothetical protein
VGQSPTTLTSAHNGELKCTLEGISNLVGLFLSWEWDIWYLNIEIFSHTT